MALTLLKEGDTFTVCDKDLANVPNGDPDVTYTLKRLDPKTHKAILKRHTKEVFERGVGRVEKTNAEASADDVLDYVLVGWTGVLLDGQPAECSRELKLAGLDFQRRNALIDLAGTNASAAEVRAESFRPTPSAV